MIVRIHSEKIISSKNIKKFLGYMVEFQRNNIWLLWNIMLLLFCFFSKSHSQEFPTCMLFYSVIFQLPLNSKLWLSGSIMSSGRVNRTSTYFPLVSKKIFITAVWWWDDRAGLGSTQLPVKVLINFSLKNYFLLAMYSNILLINALTHLGPRSEGLKPSSTTH